MSFTGVTKAHGPSPPANSMQVIENLLLLTMIYNWSFQDSINWTEVVVTLYPFRWLQMKNKLEPWSILQFTTNAKSALKGQTTKIRSLMIDIPLRRPS